MRRWFTVRHSFKVEGTVADAKDLADEWIDENAKHFGKADVSIESVGLDLTTRTYTWQVEIELQTFTGG